MKFSPSPTLPSSLALLSLSLALGTTGCAPREAKNTGANVSANSTATVWNWSTFPKADRLLIAQLPSHAGPARTEPLRSIFAGKLVLTPGLNFDQPLAAGTVWASIETEETNTDADALKRLDAEIAARTQRYLDLEKAGLLAQLDKDLRTADEAVAASTFAESQPALFTGERPALDPSLRPALSAKQLTDAAAALRARRDRIANSDTALDPADLQSLRAERERRVTARDARERQLKLTLPFAGRVLLADRRDGRSIAAGETLALAVEPALLRIRLRSTSPLLMAAAADSLEAEISLPGGTTLRAPFTSAGFDPNVAGTALMWFDVAVGPEVFDVLGAAGADLSARIYTKLPAPALIVPKLLVAREDRAEALAGGWRDAIPKIFSGAKLVAEGRTTVAIEAPANTAK